MKIVRLSKDGNLNRIAKVFNWFRFSGRGPVGPGFQIGGTTDQLVKKASNDDFDFEYFTLTKDFIDLGNVTDDAQLKRSAGDFQSFTQKISPEVGDSLIIEDSSDGENKKRITLEGIKNLFLSFFLNRSANDFSTFTEKVIPVSSDIMLIEDSESAGVKKKVELGNLPGGGGGGILELQSTAILNNDTFVDFSLVAGKHNVFFFENVKTSAAGNDIYMRVSTNGGLSFIDAINNYKWVNNIGQSNAFVFTNAGNSGSNTLIMAGAAGTPNIFSGSFETSPPISGQLMSMRGKLYYEYQGLYAANSLWAGHWIGTTLITDIQMSAKRVAGGLVSGKIHYYTKNLG